MSVRNFWVEVVIDGRKTVLSGGPRSKTGGMNIRIYQRDKGTITQPIYIDCRESHGQLSTYIRTLQNGDSNNICIETER